MSDSAEGITSQRVIELEKDAAFRSGVDTCIAALTNYPLKGEIYRRAFKRAINLLKELKA